MNNIFTLNWKNVLGAVASSMIVALLGYIVSVADIWKISFHVIVSVSTLAGAASLLKAFLTDSNGSLMGILPVK